MKVLIACFVVSGICLVLQIMNWIGNSMRGASLGRIGGAYGFGYMIGSNFALILAIVFLIVGLHLKRRR